MMAMRYAKIISQSKFSEAVKKTRLGEKSIEIGHAVLVDGVGIKQTAKQFSVGPDRVRGIVAKIARYAKQ